MGLISADPAAQTRLRGRPAPQPSGNFGPRLCECKDFIGPVCVVGNAADELPISVYRRNVNRRFNICSFCATFIAIHHTGRQAVAHILVVEDDADVQSIVSEFLVSLGHRLTCASSAEAAAEMIVARLGRLGIPMGFVSARSDEVGTGSPTRTCAT